MESRMEGANDPDPEPEPEPEPETAPEPEPEPEHRRELERRADAARLLCAFFLAGSACELVAAGWGRAAAADADIDTSTAAATAADTVADTATDTATDGSRPSRSVRAVAVDLNEAPAGVLAALPGVGPVLASRIVAGRADGPYHGPFDLRRVAGVGETTIDRLLPHAAFAEPTLVPVGVTALRRH